MLRYVAFMLLYLNFVMGLNVLKIYKRNLVFSNFSIVFDALVIPSFSSILYLLFFNSPLDVIGREMRDSTHSIHSGLEHVLLF